MPLANAAPATAPSVARDANRTRDLRLVELRLTGRDEHPGRRAKPDYRFPCDSTLGRRAPPLPGAVLLTPAGAGGAADSALALCATSTSGGAGGGGS
jgi:hypothetical protein